MKLRALTLAVVMVAGLSFADKDHENHETIEKVMKEGLKGETSYFGKVKEGTAEASDYTALYELVRTMRGTTAPVGEQGDYDQKIEALIMAAGATAYTTPTDATIASLKDAANCKACHDSHKPE